MFAIEFATLFYGLVTICDLLLPTSRLIYKTQNAEKGSSIYDVKQFLTIFDTHPPPHIVTRFITKAIVPPSPSSDRDVIYGRPQRKLILNELNIGKSR